MEIGSKKHVVVVTVGKKMVKGFPAIHFPLHNSARPNFLSKKIISLGSFDFQHFLHHTTLTSQTLLFRVDYPHRYVRREERC
jgi:hypothetical protein